MGPPVADLQEAIPEATRRHFVERLNLAVQRGERQCSLDLYPEEFGRVQAYLSFAGEKLTLSLKLENTQAQQVVQQALPELRTSLESHGLTIGELEVSLSGGDSAFTQSQRYPQAAHGLLGGRVRAEMGAEVAEQLVAVGSLRKTSGLLDLLV
jgi:flagellar hook-length control protein FliK